MTGYNHIFLDTAIFIYFLDRNPLFHLQAKSFFSHCHYHDIRLSTSTITIEEYLMYPYLEKNHLMVQYFFNFLDDMAIAILPIDEGTAEEAAKLRAHYPSLKSMDALQLASAVVAKSQLFLTNDKQLLQVKHIPTCTLEQYPLP